MIVVSVTDFLNEKVKTLKDNVLEIRLDMLVFSIETERKLNLFLKSFPFPVIFTVRPKSFGGYFDGSDLDRINILKKIEMRDIDFIDIDYGNFVFYISELKKYFPKVKIICSYHNFQETPKDLDNLFLKIKNSFNADVYKFACFANSSVDGLRMLLFVKGQKENVAGICMGEKGSFTRILAPKVKSFFSYAYLDRKTAEGQLSVYEMEKRYRVNLLSEKTAIYALLGEDISRSPSHITHNKIFSLTKKDGVYLKISLKKEELGDFLRLSSFLPFDGFSVTAPLKEDVISFIDEVEDRRIFAVNTLKRKEGKWAGYNTDVVGFMKSLEGKIDIENKNIAVLGLGGVAKAIIFAALKKNANVNVFCRNIEKHKEFALKNNIKLYDFSKLGNYDVLINATSSFDPVEEKYILPGKVVMDVNVMSTSTLFLKKALKKGCMVINGFEMFVYQAKRQFEIWFNCDWVVYNSFCKK